MPSSRTLSLIAIGMALGALTLAWMAWSKAMSMESTLNHVHEAVHAEAAPSIVPAMTADNNT